MLEERVTKLEETISSFIKAKAEDKSADVNPTVSSDTESITVATDVTIERGYLNDGQTASVLRDYPPPNVADTNGGVWYTIGARRF